DTFLKSCLVLEAVSSLYKNNSRTRRSCFDVLICKSQGEAVVCTPRRGIPMAPTRFGNSRGFGFVDPIYFGIGQLASTSARRSKWKAALTLGLWSVRG